MNSQTMRIFDLRLFFSNHWLTQSQNPSIVPPNQMKKKFLFLNELRKGFFQSELKMTQQDFGKQKSGQRNRTLQKLHDVLASLSGFSSLI